MLGCCGTNHSRAAQTLSARQDNVLDAVAAVCCFDGASGTLAVTTRKSAKSVSGPFSFPWASWRFER